MIQCSLWTVCLCLSSQSMSEVVIGRLCLLASEGIGQLISLIYVKILRVILSLSLGIFALRCDTSPKTNLGLSNISFRFTTTSAFLLSYISVNLNKGILRLCAYLDPNQNFALLFSRNYLLAPYPQFDFFPLRLLNRFKDFTVIYYSEVYSPYFLPVGVQNNGLS